MDNEIIEQFFKANPDVKKSFDDFIVKGEYKNDTVVKYKWVCESDDGYFEDSDEDHGKVFDSQEDAYYDMRDAVLSKMTWNTDWNDVLEDCEPYEKDGLTVTDGDISKPNEDNWGLSYKVVFHPNMIQHESYSGLYTYKIVRIVNEK